MIKPNDGIQMTLSSEQYRALIEMVQVADWVITCRETEPCVSTGIYRNVRKAVLANVAAVGMQDDIHFEDGEYFETLAYEDNAPHRGFIDTYDNETFWDELMTRLVERDLRDKFTESEVAEMSMEKRVGEKMPIQDAYEAEFVENDIDRLRIAEDGG